MLGLRTEDSKEFLKFFEFVQECANKRDCVFFLDFGECKDISFKDMIIDDLFGWLIPKNKVYEFNKKYLNWSIGDKDDNKWDKYLVWCIPEIENNNLKINFVG